MARTSYFCMVPAFILLLSLQVDASSLAEPDISVTPASYSWGQIVVGLYAPDFSEKTFKIENKGRGPLNITRIDITGDVADFSIKSGASNQIVDPGQFATVVVLFLPKSHGNKTAIVRIFSNDPDNNPFLVTCTGEGYLMLSVNPATLDFGIALNSLTFQVSNTGADPLLPTLEYWINEVNDIPWITSVVPEYGSVENTTTIAVEVDRNQLNSASDTRLLRVQSSGGTLYVTVNIAQSEAVSTPIISSGPSAGKVGQELTFIASGSKSNVGDPIEYQFDWGDGSQSAWGSATQSHSYSSDGSRQVKARARCGTHPSIVSDWSAVKSVFISYCSLTINVIPGGSGIVSKNPAKTDYSYNESVQLTANAGTDYKFDHWSGDLGGTENPKSITVKDNQNVTANFIPLSGSTPHFTFTQTFESYSIVVNSATLDGVLLAAGDEIGIFTPAGLCVGASAWTGVTPLAMTAWKDNAQTPAIDGYKYGDFMSFRVLDAGSTIEYPAFATFTTGNGTFGNGLFSIVSRLEATTAVQHAITLKAGWNWISTNVAPKAPGMDQVFSQTPHLSILINGVGQFYIPGVINSIGKWQVLDGYKLYVTANDSVSVTGNRVAATTPIALAAGWNFVSYLPDYYADIDTPLASILSKVAMVKQDDGKFFIPGVINSIGSMKMGEGYKLYVNNACTLIYPAGIKFAYEPPKETISSSAVHFNYRTNTGDYYSIVIDDALIDNAPLTPGSEIGVFNRGGICVGAIVWDGTKPKALSAWADDSQTTTVKDGYLSSDEMSFRIWNAKDSQNYTAVAQYSFGTDKFEEAIYTRVAKLQATTGTGVTGAFDSQPIEFKLQSYPNPFNPETNITFELLQTEKVSIVVYNMHGEKVATLMDGNLGAGAHKLTWNAATEPSGLYFCRFTTEQYFQTLKLILVK
jgi:hypothetical protein